MIVLRKMRFFLRLGLRMKFLLFETYLMLGWVRVQIMARPFSFIAPTLGTAMEETPACAIPSHQQTIRDVGYAIDVMSKYTPWDSRCLVRAIAGMRLLARRHIPSTLYLGTSLDAQTGKLAAHAWLRSGSDYVTGANAMAGYSVIGLFAKRAPGSPEGA